RSIKSILRRGRFFAPSSLSASSPGSPGSTASCGTAPGKATRATCGGSILERERSWRGSTCRPEWPCRGSSSMAASSSSAAAEARILTDLPVGIGTEEVRIEYGYREGGTAVPLVRDARKHRLELAQKGARIGRHLGIGVGARVWR